MAKYTESQALSKAKMVVNQFGSRIIEACSGSGVDPAFLAGKIGVEAGVKNGKIVESATRFEPHVYNAFISLRDNGNCIVKGKQQTSYNGIKQAQIIGANNAALKALSTSYSLSQIMGWHMINNLKGTIADLRDPEKHLKYTIDLMKIMAGSYLKNKQYEQCLRIWNTGKPNGKTHDPDYVHNALLVMEKAKPLLKNLKTTKTISTTAAINVVPENEEHQQVNKVADSIIISETGNDQPPKNEPKDIPMDAPAPEGLKEKLTSWFKWLIAFLFPAGVMQAIKSAQEDGTIKASELLGIGLEIFKFIFPYLAIIAMLYVLYRICKMLMVQVSFLVQMWINGNPDLNNIEVVPVENTKEPKTALKTILSLFKK